jgi:outer membrane protein OmpA-like peptidoglycan-associated protein
MSKKAFLIFIFTIFICFEKNVLLAQNLIKNPGFELLKPKSIVVPCDFTMFPADFGSKIDTWTSFQGMTPDINRAGETCDLFPTVYSGENCVGIVTYLPSEDLVGTDNFREMVQGKLTKALRPGKKYKFEIWVREEEQIIRRHLSKIYDSKTPVMPIHAGNLGIWFRAEPFENYFSFQKSRSKEKITPQVLFSKPIVTNGAWVKLESEFTAKGLFQYFIIGNFSSDKNTPTDLIPSENMRINAENAKKTTHLEKTKRCAYLCLDDLSLTELNPPILCPPKPIAKRPNFETTLLQDRKFSLDAMLLFDVDKADLKPQSKEILDSLVAFMVKYPEKRIEIAGHTDNRGSSEYNLDLAGRRAQALVQFLIEKNIAPQRLEWKSYSKTRPIVSNENETGRRKNRRVECVLLE